MRPDISEKDYAFPCWIPCVGALVRVEGCPWVGLGLESAFSSVWLALECLAYVQFRFSIKSIYQLEL
jgi:hypothetical protein